MGETPPTKELKFKEIMLTAKISQEISQMRLIIANIRRSKWKISRIHIRKKANKLTKIL